jgi:hypothetical protein
MAKVPLKVRLCLEIAVCIAIAATLFPLPYLARRENTAAYICNQCGIRLRTVSNELVGSWAQAHEQRTLEPTELSRWFESHISDKCQHTWQFNHSGSRIYASLAGVRLWTYSGSAGSSVTPRLVFFSADDRAHVESLLKESGEACRQHIHASLVKEGSHRQPTGDSL